VTVLDHLIDYAQAALSGRIFNLARTVARLYFCLDSFRNRRAPCFPDPFFDVFPGDTKAIANWNRIHRLLDANSNEEVATMVDRRPLVQ